MFLVTLLTGMVFEDKYMRKTSNSESLIKKALTQYVMTV